MAMIIFFLVSIVQSLAQGYLNDLKEESEAKSEKPKKDES